MPVGKCRNTAAEAPCSVVTCVFYLPNGLSNLTHAVQKKKNDLCVCKLLFFGMCMYKPFEL